MLPAHLQQKLGLPAVPSSVGDGVLESRRIFRQSDPLLRMPGYFFDISSLGRLFSLPGNVTKQLTSLRQQG
ncbi:hypothetical protein Gotri_008184 [Gossypium trilobum]|uniref:Uncharacterized protein n=1 Tax=Gossypium trilobum TaxID=34281 RepID=A0A7J9EIK7_9ROSI|nr:hypothetical protein [Gossypium trilobum]